MQFMEHMVHRRQLQRYRHVITGRAITIVVDELGVGLAIGDVCLGCVVLLRLHIQVAQHAHLHVLGGLLVAVVHVGAGVVQAIEVGDGRTHIHTKRALWHTVKHGRLLREAMEVHRVRIKQVGAHGHRHVGQRQVEVLAFLQLDGGCRKFGIQRIQHHFIGRHVRHIGKTKGVHTAAVRHADETVACAQVHALHASRQIGQGLDCPRDLIDPHIVGAALNKHSGMGPGGHSECSHCSQGTQVLAKFIGAHVVAPYLLFGSFTGINCRTGSEPAPVTDHPFR